MSVEWFQSCDERNFITGLVDCRTPLWDREDRALVSTTTSISTLDWVPLKDWAIDFEGKEPRQYVIDNIRAWLQDKWVELKEDRIEYLADKLYNSVVLIISQEPMWQWIWSWFYFNDLYFATNSHVSSADSAFRYRSLFWKWSLYNLWAFDMSWQSIWISEIHKANKELEDISIVRTSRPNSWDTLSLWNSNDVSNEDYIITAWFEIVNWKIKLMIRVWNIVPWWNWDHILMNTIENPWNSWSPIFDLQWNVVWMVAWKDHSRSWQWKWERWEDIISVAYLSWVDLSWKELLSAKELVRYFFDRDIKLVFPDFSELIDWESVITQLNDLINRKDIDQLLDWVSEIIINNSWSHSFDYIDEKMSYGQQIQKIRDLEYNLEYKEKTGLPEWLTEEEVDKLIWYAWEDSKSFKRKRVKWDWYKVVFADLENFLPDLYSKAVSKVSINIWARRKSWLGLIWYFEHVKSERQSLIDRYPLSINSTITRLKREVIPDMRKRFDERWVFERLLD